MESWIGTRDFEKERIQELGLVTENLRQMQMQLHQTKKVLVLGFDSTITNIPTFGAPGYKLVVDSNNKKVKYILTNKKNYIDDSSKNALRKLFNDCSVNDIPIYINTSGRFDLVATYLESLGLTQFIKKIYGSKDIKNITGDWSERKVKINEKIVEKEGIDKSQLYFFDAKEENIKKSQESGFSNSFLATNNCIKNTIILIRRKLELDQNTVTDNELNQITVTDDEMELISDTIKSDDIQQDSVINNNESFEGGIDVDKKNDNDLMIFDNTPIFYTPSNTNKNYIGYNYHKKFER